MKLIGSILAICSLLGIFFGAYCWIDNRYALAQQMKQIEQRLDYKIKSDQVQVMQQRIWQIEDRCATRCDVTVKEEKRKLQSELDTTKEQMKALEKK